MTRCGTERGRDRGAQLVVCSPSTALRDTSRAQHHDPLRYRTRSRSGGRRAVCRPARTGVEAPCGASLPDRWVPGCRRPWMSAQVRAWQVRCVDRGRSGAVKLRRCTKNWRVTREIPRSQGSLSVAGGLEPTVAGPVTRRTCGVELQESGKVPQNGHRMAPSALSGGLPQTTVAF